MNVILTLRPSRLQAAYGFGILILASAAGFFVLNSWLWAIFQAACAAAAIDFYRRWRKVGGMILKLGDEGAQIGRAGRLKPARLIEASVGMTLCVTRWQTKTRHLSLSIWCDSLESEEYRRLRVWLLWSKQTKEIS